MEKNNEERKVLSLHKNSNNNVKVENNADSKVVLGVKKGKIVSVEANSKETITKFKPKKSKPNNKFNPFSAKDNPKVLLKRENDLKKSIEKKEIEQLLKTALQISIKTLNQNFKDEKTAMSVLSNVPYNRKTLVLCNLINKSFVEALKAKPNIEIILEKHLKKENLINKEVVVSMTFG